MRNVYTRSAAASMLLVVTAVSSPLLLADAVTDARLDSIERKLDSRGLLDLLNRVEQMQQTIQQLRGELEVQAHTLDEMQRLYILRVLAETEWMIEGQHGAAQVLGMKPSTLRNRMHKLGIVKPSATG